jgi:hypothetical protein
MCLHYKWASDMPYSLLVTGVIFPISFIISFAIGRRERMLLDIASMKADIIGFYHLMRDWGTKCKKARVGSPTVLFFRFLIAVGSPGGWRSRSDCTPSRRWSAGA